ncbi:cation transporter [Candidatus Peregrinibacteria bacterium]|nr:cation transporter [Candidatus Peregrinibacteria bacterium]
MQEHDHTHDHTHGVVDATLTTSARGLWAIKWSFIGLAITALLQSIVVIISGSVALLADTIHNFGDAATALPLGIAFLFSRRKATSRFPYGYGRVEDLAGLIIILIIFLSAVVAAYQAIDRFFHPQTVSHLGMIIIASLVGFLGNELVAIFRIKVGKEIKSAALIADGYHARVDGWTSLAVLFGALGIWFGFPLADPLVGLGITIAIFFIVWDSVKSVLFRSLDGIEPEIIHKIEHVAMGTKGVHSVKSVKARWVGHRVYTEIALEVDPKGSFQEIEKITKELKHQLHHDISYLEKVVIELVS